MKQRIDLFILVLVLLGMAVAMVVLWQVMVINIQLQKLTTSLSEFQFERLDETYSPQE